MTLRVYVSGPMTGLPELNFDAFARAAQALRAAGYDVVNPAVLNAPDVGWHECLKVDIQALCLCNALALLPGWTRSKGSHLELQIAHRLGYEIGTVDEFLAAADRPDLTRPRLDYRTTHG